MEAEIQAKTRAQGRNTQNKAPCHMLNKLHPNDLSPIPERNLPEHPLVACDCEILQEQRDFGGH